MDSGVTKIDFSRSAFFSFTQKLIGRISLQKALFCAFLTFKNLFLRRVAFLDPKKKVLRKIYIFFGLQTHKEIYFHLILFRPGASKTGVQGGTKSPLKKKVYIYIYIYIYNII